eukprot:TRINITY_DN8405_c0_g2_i7.p1 TRINITY_DN8405_c0_g2~~TRINITY_DN8405_c0_g2_i7.p1  ORF type:complete len:556 (-),score=90.92 TRINITY_DN8405_c0_g2_i7:152-1819(-)
MKRASAKNILWEYLDGRMPVFFSKEEMRKIEKEYEANAAGLAIGFKDSINFTNMEMTKNGYRSPIKRIILDESIPAMVNNRRGRWQYLGDEGTYTSYAPDIDKTIESAYRAQLTRRGIFINERFYIIDFVTMSQTNPLSRFERPIKRVAEAEGLKIGAVWAWVDDQGVYRPYALAEMKVLEANHLKKSTVRVESNHMNYIINLTNMTQCNVHTKKSRSIRRIPLNILASPIPWEYETAKGFVPCSDKDSELIEKAYQEKKREYNGPTFSVDFVTMTSANTRTGAKGRIRRSGAVGPSSCQYLWQYLSDNGYVSYAAGNNGKIEEAYQNGKPYLLLTERGASCTIHFDTMEQEEAKGSYYRAVRRINEKAKKWTYYQSLLTVPTLQLPSIAELDPRSTKYEFVRNCFDKSMKGMYGGMRVMKIKNKKSEELYKEQMSLYEKRYKAKPLVLDLFYGTKDVHPSKIYNSSAEWGMGIYFTSNASAVCNGLEYREKGKCYVLLAKVMVGEPQDFIPTKASATNPKNSLNAIKVKSADADIYIVPNGNMAIPKYLIEYIE